MSNIERLIYDAEFVDVPASDMTMSQFLDVTQLHGFDKKLEQLASYVQSHPEIGRMSAWDFLRSAFRQVECPACVGHGVGPVGCKYCAGTGKVDCHLVSHPMNVYAIAKEMRGK